MRMVTNIVAGIVLLYVLRRFLNWILEMRSIREVKKANEKINFLLKPYVSGGAFPPPETYYAIKETVASDYHVAVQELNTFAECIRGFIEEIFEDAYIPADQKMEYTNNLQVQLEAYEELSSGEEILRISGTSAPGNGIFDGDNQLNICLLLSGFLVALFGFLSGTYNIFQSFGIFLGVCFALVIFTDLCLKKKRYLEIPRWWSNAKQKMAVSWESIMNNHRRTKKEREQDEVVRLKKQLKEEKDKLNQWSDELLQKQRELEAKEKNLSTDGRETSGQNNKEKRKYQFKTRLETQRLILRPWEESDAEELYRYAQDDRIGPSCGWQVHTSMDNSHEIIRDVLSSVGNYAIVLKETNLVVGSIGLMIGENSNLGVSDTEAEIGYWIGVPYWGQGLIPEAVCELMRYAFEELGLKKLWCGYYEGNTKSKRVQEKCGFHYHHTNVGVYVDQMNEERTEHISCINRDEWESKYQNAS
ncbi:GNAT family N-acetyltransferase [Blautia liquoris]